MAEFPPVDENFMPIGLAMSLSVDSEAMKAFSALSPDEQDNVMLRARDAQSRDEMEGIVRSIHGE